MIWLNKTLLAPLDNVNCASYRILCKEYGAGLVSTPMINTNAYLHNPSLFYWYEEERPLLVQFIGSEPEEFKECVQNVSDCDVVDLNAGCPSPSQTKRGAGSALLKNLPKLRKIIQTMVKYSPVPVSVKIRMGWEKDNSVKISKNIEDSGASFLTIHPRTVFDSYGVPADWQVIKKVKENVNIPVIASGDLITPINVKKCLETTGCDAVMLARGAITNPFIFNDSLHYLETGELRTHSKQERLDLVKEFIKLYKEYEKGFSISELRNHCSWLVKGFPGARRLRGGLGECNSVEEVMELVEKC